MRTYLTTTAGATKRILRDGFTGLVEEFGMRGVYLATRQLGADDGCDGDVTLCLDVSDELFAEFDVMDGLQEKSGYRVALIPAARLTEIGKPQVYDHPYAGLSRRELVKSVQFWNEYPDAREKAHEMREAVEFFDGIGWPPRPGWTRARSGTASTS